MKNASRDGMATMFLEGVRLSGRPLTLTAVRRGFEAGYEAGRKSAEALTVKSRHRHKWSKWEDSLSRGWQFRSAKCDCHRVQVRKKGRRS